MKSGEIKGGLPCRRPGSGSLCGSLCGSTRSERTGAPRSFYSLISVNIRSSAGFLLGLKRFFYQ